MTYLMGARTPCRRPGGVQRSAGDASVVQELLEFAGLMHLGHDVRTTDEFPLHVELGNRGPVGKLLDALAHAIVLEDVDGDQLLQATGFQQLDGATRETALR